jgi:RNA polymerase-binding transcription factor DksA
MTTSESNYYRTVLEARQSELRQLLRNRDGIAIENSADTLGEVPSVRKHKLAIRHRDPSCILLQSVRESLRLVYEGSLGVCPRCEEGISDMRLTAIPCTELCSRCKVIAERNQSKSANDLDELLVSA